MNRKTINEVLSLCNVLHIDDEDAMCRLRRAAMTLHRWAEQECGDSNEYASWCITRDEKTGKPFREVCSHTSGKNRLEPIPDRETGALRSVSRICADLGLHWYHQTDPRGAPLYLSREPLTDQTYSRAAVVPYLPA